MITDADRGKISIVSGEGEIGTTEIYMGKHTERGLKKYWKKKKSIWQI